MAPVLIADIRRLTIHDGPGTRTTVFVKGCPLRCLWCHNPETVSARPQLLYHDRLCSRCRKCESVCEEKVHSFSTKDHKVDFGNCRQCGKCAESCWYNALEICGKRFSPQELLAVLQKDKMFYATSGGGVTVSGGEPLLYPEFVGELFELLHDDHIHTALDTCGYVPFEYFQRVLPFTDLILYDLKGMDEEKHRENTGVSNRLILDNLEKLSSFSVPVEVRMPVVPGYNDSDEEFCAAGEFLRSITVVKRVRLLPYHAMARQKYAASGVEDTMPDVATPDNSLLQSKADILKKHISAEIVF